MRTVPSGNVVARTTSLGDDHEQVNEMVKTAIDTNDLLPLVSIRNALFWRKGLFLGPFGSRWSKRFKLAVFDNVSDRISLRNCKKCFGKSHL